MIEVNLSVRFKAGADYDEMFSYAEKVCDHVEDRIASARWTGSGTSFEEDGGYTRDMHFEVASTEEGLTLLGVLVARLLDDGWVVVPERTDGLIRDENTMDDDRLTVGEVGPGQARVGVIVFKRAVVSVG